MKTIQYKEFPKKVRSFIESYFFDLFLKNKSLKEQLNLLHISSETLPESYPKFVKAEFSPPYKISYFGNNVNWGGVVHDTTHFLQYHTNKEEFEKERQLLKVATFNNYSMYYENKFEKEAFVAQEEFNKYTSLKFSTFYTNAWISPNGAINEVDDHAIFAVENILSPYSNVEDVDERIVDEIISKLHKQGWIRVSGAFPDFIGVSLHNLDYVKKKYIEDYLIKYKVDRNVKIIIDDQQSLGSIGFDGIVEEFLDLEKLSWKIMSDEFYNLEGNLRNKNIHFKSSNGIINIIHEGNVSLYSLTQLPDNVFFNNKGNVYLSSLTQLPDNVQFNNKGNVDLYSLTQLPDNVQFNNKGNVFLSSLTQLSDNKEQIFKNDGKVWYNNGSKTYDPRTRKLSWKEYDVSDLKGIWLNSWGDKSPAYNLLSLLSMKKDGIPLSNIRGDVIEVNEELHILPSDTVEKLQSYNLISIDNEVMNITPKGKYWVSVLALRENIKKEKQQRELSYFDDDILRDIKPFIKSVYSWSKWDEESAIYLFVCSKNKLVEVEAVLDINAFLNKRIEVITVSNPYIKEYLPPSFKALVNIQEVKNNIKTSLENMSFDDFLSLQRVKGVKWNLPSSSNINWKETLSWQSGKDSYKDLSFNYDKDRGQQIDEYEAGVGGSSTLSPLVMKQPWNTENLVTDIDQDELKEKSLNWQDRNNTQLWI